MTDREISGNCPVPYREVCTPSLKLASRHPIDLPKSFVREAITKRIVCVEESVSLIVFADNPKASHLYKRGGYRSVL